MAEAVSMVLPEHIKFSEKDLVVRDRDIGTTWVQHFDTGEIFPVGNEALHSFIEPVKIWGSNSKNENMILPPICRRLPKEEVEEFTLLQTRITELSRIAFGRKKDELESALKFISEQGKSVQEWLNFYEVAKESRQPLTEFQTKIYTWIRNGAYDVVPAEKEMLELKDKLREIGLKHKEVIVKKIKMDQEGEARQKRQAQAEETAAAVAMAIGKKVPKEVKDNGA